MDETIFRQFTQNFQASHQTTPLIVYDVDDILWDLTRRIALKRGLDPDICYAIFRIPDNPELTKADQDYIIKSFANADIFRNIDFHPGIIDLLRPESLGAKVKINSNCFSQAIADLKISQLLQAIPGLTTDDIQVNIIDHSKALRKPLNPETTLLIDDSPHNIAESPALLNIMPSRIPWSCHPAARKQVAHQTVVWQPNLSAINDFVYQAVSYLANHPS